MALQESVELGNYKLDGVEVVAGASAIIKIRTGAPPANCATADAGTVLATVNLPADWMSAAANRSKAAQGSWLDAAADAAGTAGHFRLYKNDGVTCVLQGTVAVAGGDMNVDNLVFAVGQQFTIQSFTLSSGNV